MSTVAKTSVVTTTLVYTHPHCQELHPGAFPVRASLVITHLIRSKIVQWWFPPIGNQFWSTTVVNYLTKSLLTCEERCRTKIVPESIDGASDQWERSWTMIMSKPMDEVSGQWLARNVRWNLSWTKEFFKSILKFTFLQVFAFTCLPPGQPFHENDWTN